MFQIKKTEYFSKWYKRLKDVGAQKKIAFRILQTEQGNFGDFKFIGDGIYEMRINYGPGYRIYYTKEDDVIVLLLVGGDKSTQQKDIEKAKELKNEKSDAEVSDLDIAELLDSEEVVKLFLEEALAANDPVLWQRALSYAARSAGMAKIAQKAGLNRESLYKALKEDAHPRFDTVMRVLNAMGLKLTITPCVAEKQAKYSAK